MRIAALVVAAALLSQPLNAQTVSPGAEAVPSAPTHSENSRFEGIYRGFAYFEFILDAIVNRLLSTAPIESFKRPLPSTRQPSPHRVPVYIEATVLQPAAAGPRTFVAFQLTGDDGKREELPTLLAVNTGAFSWDLPLMYRYEFLGQPSECNQAAEVSANSRRTTAGARKPSRSISHCWL